MDLCPNISEAPYVTKNKFIVVYHKILFLLYSVCLFFAIYMCFQPLASIGTVSMGSTVEIIKELFKSQLESTKYLSEYFYVFAFLNVFFCIVIFVICMYHLFSSTWMSPPSWQMFLGNAFSASVLVVIYYFVLKSCCYYYNCVFITSYKIVLLVFLPHLLVSLLGGLILMFKKYERKKSVRSKGSENSVINTKKLTVPLIILLICSLSLCALPIYMFITEPTSVINSHMNCEVNWWFQSGYLKVGKTNMYAQEHSVLVNKEKGLRISLTDNSTVWEEHSGDNYLYYLSKISELKTMISELEPEEVSSDDQEEIANSMQQYLKKIAELESGIKQLENKVDNLPYNYARIEFGPLVIKKEESGKNFWGGTEYTYFCGKQILSYTHNRDVTYCDEEGKKWGYSDGSLASFLLGEKIKLSKTSFSFGTDFESERILATVSYSDGSVKISYITPSNYKELNSAGSGEHIFSWSDEWGDYQVKICITSEEICGALKSNASYYCLNDGHINAMR